MRNHFVLNLLNKGATSKLPENVIINILVRLPAKSTLRFRCVCKQWLKLTSDHDFIKLHFEIATENGNLRLMVGRENMYSTNLGSIFHNVNRSKKIFHKEVLEIDYPFKARRWGMSVVGSCNGLLCVANLAQQICIWNPLTNMYKVVSSLSLDVLGCHGNILGFKYGFCYDSHAEEYKVVRIIDLEYDFSVIEVYVEGSNTFEAYTRIPFSFTFGDVFGVLVNGNLHWIGNHRSGSGSLILAFRIRDESFAELPLPENVKDLSRVSIGVLGGDLCLTDYRPHTFSIDVWVLKVSVRGETSSWSVSLTIHLPFTTASLSLVGVKLLHSFKNGEILLRRDANTLLLYHPTDVEPRIVKIRGIPDA
ncbi:F-box/kelch-repeat protein At3g06240-like [Papaver somniferum]|uniref:F-box/kelch-repeat protein At3g06240-like n=1 Tax=Papaver somniferum TaxID=3469 RepID=UPI000E6FF350|nr:F-box/kelch-repeat protein At3g06240-like [Papaver somniferum]